MEISYSSSSMSDRNHECLVVEAFFFKNKYLVQNYIDILIKFKLFDMDYLNNCFSVLDHLTDTGRTN